MSAWGHPGQRLKAGLAWAPLPAESGVAPGMVLRRLVGCAEALVKLGGEVTPQQAFGDSRPLQCTQAMLHSKFFCAGNPAKLATLASQITVSVNYGVYRVLDLYSPA